MMHDWRSCIERADLLERRRHLERRRQRRQERVDLGAGDRQVDLADVEHRVAEREHLVAVDVRDGAGAGGAHVAADELDGDRAAVLERATGRRRCCGRRRRPAAAPRGTARARCDSSAKARGAEAGERQRHRRAHQARLAAVEERAAAAGARAAASARRRRLQCAGGDHVVERAALGRPAARAERRLGHRRRRARPRSGRLSSASMVSIGVTPAIGSLAKCQP